MQDNAPRGLVQGGRGFCAGAPHGFGCQVICVLLLLLDSSHCDFIPGPPLPLALVSMWTKCLCFHRLVSVMVQGGWLPLTGLSWIP